jgi:phosphoribosylamine--glycine ligase
VVIEEYLAGPEVSLFGVTDGKTVRALSPAQDFKRALDNDEGPNTGGMGAYSPLDWAPKNLVSETIERVLQPTIDEMAKRGTPFSGLLYVGLALTASGIKVIEFNARFGDPETQVVVARLESPLSELLSAAANGTLAELPELQWSDEAAITVVLAAQGYPQDPVAGAPISGLQRAQESGSFVYHAGTQETDAGERVVSGGRVLCVTGTGLNLADAREKVYAGVKEIKFSGSHHRTDIALQASRGEIEVP